jgi:hypothetical protein
MRKFLSCIFILLNGSVALAQHDKAPIPITLNQHDTVKVRPVDSASQRDMLDVIKSVVHKTHQEDDRLKFRKITFSLLPAVGYSLSTGFAVTLSSNVLFYTTKDGKDVNPSLINASGFLDTYNQRSVLLQSDIWTDHNNYDLTTDFRWLKYPGETYGLGATTTPEKSNDLNYNYVKFYATLLRKIIPNYYIGLGYNLDYHTNLTQSGNEDGSVSDLTKYGGPYTTNSSGLNIDLLYDKRENPINPVGGGAYANIIFRQNYNFLGSNDSWESLIVDLRKYFKTSPNNNNVLAFWWYSWFTFNGNTPYLDLPATGWDPSGSTGRGYAEGRFRGKDMLYAEAEFRFGITHNGLLGGVLFANGQTYPEYPNGGFQKIIPAAGTGLRIKLNKHSNTNICVDYGFGIDGSRGFFVNLGEGF